ncbi:uroporphyrinogen-III synthase [Dermacoccus abyssi]|uniref:uroporphyrinogen-III synthase n=1 Tax=Dermacoccus abyssi TaxID=322596 RepID=UPI0021A71701|nr:uroporphyrinogen-III synthase [Dermacoccus abyssi]MCT1986250.1 uroporphyrinogen-III synthase [Dermacoccus abyssi]
MSADAPADTSAPRLEQHLSGMRVILTAQRRADDFASALRRRGAEVVHAPTLSHVPHVNDPRLLARTRELIAGPPDVVVVTTGVGFRGWIEAADAAGLAGELLQALGRARIVARGPKAQGAIQREGLDVEWTAESETSQEIGTALLADGVSGLRVAVQHHGAGADGVDEQLRDAGADVVSLVVYRWGPAPDPGAVEHAVHLVAQGEADCVAFTSAPATQAFLDAAQSAGVFDLVVESFRHGRVVAAAVGDTTAAPLRAQGIEPLVPDRYRMGALVRAITALLRERREPAVLTPAGSIELTRDGMLLEGRELALTPATLGVLRRLVTARGSVVSREELLKGLPGAADGHSVEVAIARLRQALGVKEVIVTVIKRGYRLEVLGA